MPRELPKIQALNLYLESALWIVCPHADKIPFDMLALVLAACKTSDHIDFERWCESCHIQIVADEEVKPEPEPEPKQEFISPLTDSADRHGESPAFPSPQSQMSEEDIINHNEAGLADMDSMFPAEILEKPKEPDNDAPVKYAGADRSSV